MNVTRSRSIDTLAYNVYKFRGWSEGSVGEAGDTDGDDPDIARRMVEHLEPLDADVISLSEAPSEDVVRGIASELGMNWRFFPSTEEWPGTVLSQFSIEASADVSEFAPDAPAELFTRHAGRVVLEIGTTRIALYTVHLHPKDDAVRMREVTRLLDRIRDDRRAGLSILLQGDLNHKPTDPEYETWQENGLTDAFEAAGIGGGKTIKADSPGARIDYVWAAGDLADRIRSAGVVDDPPFGSGPDGDACSGPYLSDHLPVVATFDR